MKAYPDPWDPAMLSDFILFGTTGTKTFRREAAEKVFRFFHSGTLWKTNADAAGIDALCDLQLQAFTEACPAAVMMAEGNPELARRLTEDVLEAVEGALEKGRAVSKTGEVRRILDDAREDGGSDAVMELIRDVRDAYPEVKVDWKFYEDVYRRFDEAGENGVLIGGVEVREEEIRRKLTEEIEAALEKADRELLRESLEKDLAETGEEIAGFLGKVGRMKNLLSGFFGGLGRFWDLSSGAWRRVDWDSFQTYAEILEREKEIRELAEILGRMRDEQDEMDREELREVEIRTPVRAAAAGKSEIVGLHFSDDLSALVPSETVLLASPETELLFAKHFAEKKLLTFHYRSTYPESAAVKKEEPAPRKKRGPIILCVDTSGSMHGAPERIAKATALAVTTAALKEKRGCYLISFSREIRTLDLSRTADSIPALTEFLRMGFHGGTDGLPPLREAMWLIGTEGWEKADVLFISDLVMPNLPREMYDSAKVLHDGGTRFHGLAIGKGGNKAFWEYFDTLWEYDTERSDSGQLLIRHLREALKGTPE